MVHDPDEEMFRDSIRRFVDKEVIPIEREAYEGPDMKPEVRARLSEMTKKMGLWHYGTPVEYGGQGLGMLARVVVWEQMRRTIACRRAGRRFSARSQVIRYSFWMSARSRNTCCRSYAGKRRTVSRRQNRTRGVMPGQFAQQRSATATIT